MGLLANIFAIREKDHRDILYNSGFESVIQSSPSDEAEKALLAIREDLDTANIPINGTLFKGGTYSLIFRPHGLQKTVVRMGYDDHPVESAIALQPIARAEYYLPNKARNKDAIKSLQVHFMPYAPNIPPPYASDPKVLPQDIVNTLRVLKAEGKGLEHQLVDMLNLSDGHFVYLRDSEGQYLHYPTDTPDPEMRGRPIAFVRDLNCFRDLSSNFRGRTPEQVKDLKKAIGTADIFLDDMGKTFDDLKPVPAECMAACHQQDKIIAEARAEMALKNIDPDQFTRRGELRKKFKAKRILQQAITPTSEALLKGDRSL